MLPDDPQKEESLLRLPVDCSDVLSPGDVLGDEDGEKPEDVDPLDTLAMSSANFTMRPLSWDGLQS